MRVVAFVVVAMVVCAQASHLFHTHNVSKDSTGCTVCFHKHSSSLAPVVALNRMPFAAVPYHAYADCAGQAVTWVPLRVAPKTSPPG